MNTLPQRRKQIVVLGGGYAGLLATLRIAGRTRRQDTKVVLVNASDTFVERIRLHQLATNQRLARRPIAVLLRGTGAEFVPGKVIGLDPERREVTIQTSDLTQRICYDRLVYALGSVSATDQVPGVREHALTVGGEAAALRLQEALKVAVSRSGRIVVVGGGLTGIETATEIAESYPSLDVSLVTAGTLGADLSKRGRAYLRSALDRLGISVHEQMRLREVEPARLVVDGEASIPFDLCVWTGGFIAPPLAREAGLAVNERDQVLVDPFLRSVSHPAIYVAGDAASPIESPGAPLRMGCVVAIPMGAQAANNVVADVLGRPPTPFRFAFALRCISLGRRNGLIQFVKQDDVPIERVITGRLGAWIKEFICRSTIFSLRLERRWAGAFRWPQPSGRQMTTSQSSRRSLPAGR